MATLQNSNIHSVFGEGDRTHRLAAMPLTSLVLAR
jgi:hypothetical protein